MPTACPSPDVSVLAAIVDDALAGCFGCGDAEAPLDCGYCPTCCGTSWTIAPEAEAHA